MNLQRLISRLSWIVGTVAVLYFVVGGIYVYLESQREETWHEKAVANAGDQSMQDWLDSKGSQPVAEWFLIDEKKHTYIVRFFDDRRFVSAVFNRRVSGIDNPQAAGQATRFETGTLSSAEWRSLQSSLETMFTNRDEFFERSHRKAGDVTLAYSHNKAAPMRFRLNSSEYQQWPSYFQEFDEQLFAVLESKTVKPKHGYATATPAIVYGEDDIASLARMLRSDQVVAYASIVSRMVASGEPARAPLLETLESGEAGRYLPIDRYIAVIDGLAELDDRGAGYELIKKIADTPASLPGRKKLQAHAEAVAGAQEVAVHIEQTWARPVIREARFRSSTLSASEAEAVATALGQIDLRLEARKAEGKATLIGIGEPALPAVLKQLRMDQARNRFNNDLFDVLAEVGGSDAFVYAIRENGMPPTAAIRPLERIGDKGVPGLLMLMESSDKAARQLAYHSLVDDAYATYSAQYIASLRRNLNLYRASSSAAVRTLHGGAAVNLIALLKKYSASDGPTMDVLLEAAIDTAQSDNTRIKALNVLATVTPLARAAETKLHPLSMDESRDVRNAVLAVLTPAALRR